MEQLAAPSRETQLVQARRYQVQMVLRLMSETGMREKDACREVGINSRTFLRWRDDPRVKEHVTRFAQQMLETAALAGLSKLPKILENQAEIAAGEKFFVKPSDQTKAGTFVFNVVQAVAGQVRPGRSQQPQETQPGTSGK